MRGLFLLLIFGFAMSSASFAQDNFKTPNVAGTFYPADGKKLSRLVDSFLSNGSAETLPTGVIITPHAGYVYSGAVGGVSFKAASHQDIKTVIVLGPSHYFPFNGVAVWKEGAFRTPLGDIQVDSELASAILAKNSGRFKFNKEVFEKEHSIETQLPFIQKVFPQAKIVPIILGQPDAEAAKELAEALVSAVGDREDVLVDVSADQSHFHSEEEARVIDKRGLDAIERMDVGEFWNGHITRSMEVDAFHAITAAMIYAKARGFNQVKILKYGTSAETTGDLGRVVGYAAVAFQKLAVAPSGLESLNEAQKQRLLSIARTTVETFVKTGQVPDISENDVRLHQHEGAFVTLKMHGRLRGCIGHILGEQELFKTVRDMAVAASSEDPRFSPVTPQELSDIEIEVSVLSKPRMVKRAEEIELGKHGVIVRQGFRGGVFLPQVAAETGWTKERFLSELCAQKAGLPEDAWKDPATRLEVFTADVF